MGNYVLCISSGGTGWLRQSQSWDLAQKCNAVPAVRDLCVSHCLNYTSTPHVDGCFVDRGINNAPHLGWNVECGMWNATPMAVRVQLHFSLCYTSGLQWLSEPGKLHPTSGLKASWLTEHCNNPARNRTDFPGKELQGPAPERASCCDNTTFQHNGQKRGLDAEAGGRVRGGRCQIGAA